MSVFAEGIPAFKAHHGIHNGHHAIKIIDKMARPTHLETGIPFLDEAFISNDAEDASEAAKALPGQSS